ncbi:hypothetical protein BDFB_013121, partial [Asbolus verrucosus]
KERRQALSVLRNETNFELYVQGIIRPYRQCNKPAEEKPVYYPCAACKGLFLKHYLKRHAKKCHGQISSTNLRERVYDLMRGDEIAFVAKKDLLIAQFGESYLKKHKRERMTYVCSSRMREVSRLLISFREVVHNNDVSFKDLLHPKNFDNVLFAARRIVGYDAEKKTFKVPSLAMHLGTSLKFACDELQHLILKQSRGFRWNIELGSLANKDLQEKKWNKPLLVPLVSDVKKFREETIKLAQNCERLFLENKDNEGIFKLLVQCTLALLIIFNRRRIGDVQFLKIEDYLNDTRTNFKDFENVLTQAEKILTSKYKRILNGGKGSRAIVILVPELLQNFLNIILKYRPKYIHSSDNDYIFSIPGSKKKWGKGDVALRTLAKTIKLKNPESITSNKLRKQIATVTQILSLSKDESKQFSKFMGHTERTHDEFYELPIDIYQTT